MYLLVLKEGQHSQREPQKKEHACIWDCVMIFICYRHDDEVSTFKVLLEWHIVVDKECRDLHRDLSRFTCALL